MQKHACETPNGKATESNVGVPLPASFLPPPRSIADITAILDSEKPDPATLARMKSAADAEPSDDLSQGPLAQFYYARSEARGILGRSADALADSQHALVAARAVGNHRLAMRIGMDVASRLKTVGDYKRALAMAERLMAEADQPRTRGNLFPLHHLAVNIAVAMGDLPRADEYLRQALALIEEARSGNPRWQAYRIRGSSWECSIAWMQAVIFAARGQYRSAEAAYVRAREFRMKSIEVFDKLAKTDPDVPLDSDLQRQTDSFLLNIATMKSRQGRLAEAESDARIALFSRLKADGKYNRLTTPYVTRLANILNWEGRFSKAERLVRTGLDIQRTLGIGDADPNSAYALSWLGSILTGEGKADEANEVFDQLDQAVATWDARQREGLLWNATRINALLASGRNEEALGAAQALVQHEVARFGESNYDSASARGVLAIALMRAGRGAEAIHEFKLALPVLQAAQQDSDDNDAAVVAKAEARLKFIVENYIKLLATTRSPADDIAAQTFILADSIRGHAVQQALAESSARVAAKDPALAELVRNEQDLSKQLRARVGSLNNLLNVPSSERDEKILHDVESSIARLRVDRDVARAEMNGRFPAYADLVNPKPPSIAQIKDALHDGEAALSFYFGDDASFVWAVPKSGPIAFASVEAKPDEIKSKIKKLREALEPEAALISDIPPFDVGLGYQLYSLLLKPVEAGWKQSKSLIVVTNGALGLLPLSLLPTAPSVLKSDDGPLFAGYRNVPWLARTHDVVTLPSLSALRTLRSLPAAASGRSQLIAFGDPLFNEQQAEEAEETNEPVNPSAASTMRRRPLSRRSIPKLEGIDSAELAMLPRLPDTADELKSIALALGVDPSKVLRLGRDANEKVVKTTNLSSFRIVVFATHGLATGELDGLTQPALALTAPAVAGVDGDGLLTMEEILQLRLDADWVILSACNTGAGEGAGAEAASGLGRAFFYAGTRAILVTNWSVHSQSAKELVTDLFKRQADDPKLTRAEALRQAMMALMDGPGYVGPDGKTEFTYAHPLFWAPYTILGDGGTR
ncbi:CHAT domain-containing protein [Bradyrhizobium sp. CCBAU 53338]|uniref:CHAT domain-containing tetratricopeptide repeat protein n=1 Tax=Bradyrhizobium sp. CCBAU 53338 TaxID=1325111 RepID=UPI00188C88A7|nr:CHAT domain-containing protein [Bradyrhizobium sp. CCBAU 53338]